MTTPQAPTANGSAYYRLFEYMSRTHDLTLTDSELADICNVVEAMAAAPRGHGSLDSVVLQVLSAGWEKFGDEPNTKLPDGAQMIDGEWYIPKWGCDSLEASLDALQAILQNEKGDPR